MSNTTTANGNGTIHDDDDDDDAAPRVAQYDPDTHCVVYADGTPANVPAGQSPGIVPTAYLEFAQHDAFRGKDPAVTAETHWQSSLEWRSSMWDILRRPPPSMREMERHQPIYLHGMSKDGQMIAYEVMREADFDAMFQNGLTVQSHVDRAVYLTEFLRHEMCRGTGRYYDPERLERRHPSAGAATPTKDFSIIYVKDMAELDIGKYFAGQALVSRTSYFDLARIHYPGSLQHAFCLNLSRWLVGPARPFLKSLLWGFNAPELLVGPHNYLPRMLEVIDADQIPVAYGGTSPHALGEHPFHRRYLAFTEHYLQLQQQQQQQRSAGTALSPPIVNTTKHPSTVPTSTATFCSYKAIGSPCPDDVASTVTKDSSPSSSSSSSYCISPSAQSTPASGLAKSSSISISEHGACEPSSMSATTSPFSALVATMWFGVLTLWNVIHSFALHSRTATTTVPGVAATRTGVECPDFVVNALTPTTIVSDATPVVPPVQSEPHRHIDILSTTTMEPTVATSNTKLKKTQRFLLSRRCRQSTKNDTNNDEKKNSQATTATNVTKKKKSPSTFRKFFQRDRSFESVETEAA